MRLFTRVSSWPAADGRHPAPTGCFPQSRGQAGVSEEKAIVAPNPGSSQNLGRSSSWSSIDTGSSNGSRWVVTCARGKNC
jgi:hypothetical protein